MKIRTTSKPANFPLCVQALKNAFQLTNKRKTYFEVSMRKRLLLGVQFTDCIWNVVHDFNYLCFSESNHLLASSLFNKVPQTASWAPLHNYEANFLVGGCDLMSFCLNEFNQVRVLTSDTLERQDFCELHLAYELVAREVLVALQGEIFVVLYPCYPENFWILIYEIYT